MFKEDDSQYKDVQPRLFKDIKGDRLDNKRIKSENAQTFTVKIIK